VAKTEEWEKAFKSANFTFGKNGERVLGFAQYILPSDVYIRNFDYNLERPNFPFQEQCFVGIVSLSDPPRDNVPYSVLKCQAAGIKVIMVTGDQPVTATSIARQCHIITEPKTVNEIAEEQKISLEEAFPLSDAIVIHGDQLTQMALEDEGLPESEQGKKLQKWLSKSQIVFARTSPAQKLIIVKGCQKMDYIVAVTGDGVNDSPAIKKADIGIAMGITGTDVAKDAADMVLLNDDFSAIVIGVEEGRRIFDNLKKAICYVMTSQVSEVAPFVALIIFNFPVPVSPIILLYIDLGTDLVPAISYAYEDAELDLMTRKPRNKL
jgi:sodium/potassium-transporting ATPase subunit alpha